MKNGKNIEPSDFVIIKEPCFEQIFEVGTDDLAISKVRAFEPALRGRGIFLPVEFTKTNGSIITLGFTLDRDI